MWYPKATHILPLAALYSSSIPPSTAAPPPTLSDPPRPSPPRPPYAITTPSSRISLLTKVYSGARPIPAFDLSPCLTDGFVTAAQVLATRPSTTPLSNGRYYCGLQDVEILIVNEDSQSVHDITYLDLVAILALIQGFQHDYAIRTVIFDINYVRTGSRPPVNIGIGTIGSSIGALSGYELGGTNASTTA